jgi:hypothetical protein
MMRLVCAVFGGLMVWQAWNPSSPDAVGHYLLGCAMVIAAGQVMDWILDARGGRS